MKVLIIEDEIKLSNILLQGLKEQGMAVDVARRGDAGLQAALTAGGVYNLRLRVNGSANAGGGLKLALTGFGNLTASALNCTTWNYNGTTINAVTNVFSFS